MIKPISVLLGKAKIIKDELVDLANSALRVGGWMEDEAKASVKKFDPNQPYEAGQTAIKDGVLIECVVDTLAGETPTTHPLKWSVSLVTDPQQVNESNNLPVSASAVFKFVQGKIFGNDTPENASTIKRGIVRQASDAEFENATNDDTYTTPKQVGGLYKAIVDGIQAITGISLDKALQGGPESGITPYFGGGVVASLEAVPNGVTVKGVVIAEDGTMYAGGNTTTTPTDPEPNPDVFNFTGGVHYEAVPEETEASTQPVLLNPTADWLITTRGVTKKVLEDDEFKTNPTANYRTQVFLLGQAIDQGTGQVVDTLSPLPSWLKFTESAGELEANVTSDVTDTAFPVRVIKSDQSGSGAPDDFLLTLRVPATVNPCSNYFALSESQTRGLPIVQMYEYIDVNTSMASGLTYTVRSFNTKAELITQLGLYLSNQPAKAKFDNMRASTASLNIGDTLYGDNRPEHILDSTFDRWPAGGGLWGFNATAPTQAATGSVTIIETNACGIIVSREQATLQYN